MAEEANSRIISKQQISFEIHWRWRGSYGRCVVINQFHGTDCYAKYNQPYLNFSTRYNALLNIKKMFKDLLQSFVFNTQLLTIWYVDFLSEHLDCKFDRKDLVVLAICSVFGVWYVIQKVSRWFLKYIGEYVLIIL